MTELLSPAGGREALAAAVQNGADAVYMGFGSFNARRSARNFSDEEFLAAVRYCHLWGVKVYLTLNTLVTDRELPALAETARRASEYGVDAILVQDWGVYETLRAVIPDVPLHASTQMALHTLSGVEEAARLGMTRAVLARELSGEEIREIAERAPIEIETFAHGALCMCYSGMCEMSAVIGGRSGNRGACAQPCRLRYGWHGKADANPLSLKDANLAAYAGEMAEMGVACLKLEGRMKRPEYVAAVTGIYAALLREHRAPTADEQKKLALAFSRDGFTDGLRLLIITTACAVLISVLSFVSATSGFLQNAVGVLTYPFRSAVTAVATWAEDKQRYYKDYSDLIAENEALRERVAELERDARQAEADREENALLRELLELREQRRDLTFESAAVIDRESTNWTSALTLNRGTAHGVEKNDCVVSAEGDLVGVVSAVGYNWCTVLTVIDTDTELGARVFRTQEVAVAEGDLALMGEGKLKLSYLSADAQLLSGDVVTTSGLGGFYPGGLVIGTVESVRTGDDGLAQYAVLAPAARLGELSEVFIIKDFDIVD